MTPRRRLNRAMPKAAVVPILRVPPDVNVFRVGEAIAAARREQIDAEVRGTASPQPDDARLTRCDPTVHPPCQPP